MQLKAILLSRVIAIAGPGETNPNGRVFLPSLVPAIADRYRFQKYPTSLAQADVSEGITFETGFDEDFGSINKLQAYSNGLTLEMQGPSAETKATLIKMYEWLAKDHGIAFSEDLIRRWYYVTSLRFTSDVDLTNLHPALQLAIDTVSAHSLSVGRPAVPFSTTRIVVDYDHGIVEFPQASFILERDKLSRFEENDYFSESPMPSEKHIALLEAMERMVLKNASR